MVNLLIGCGENKNVSLAAKFLNKEENFNIELANSDEELVSALTNEKFDAVIRGSLNSFNILKNIKQITKMNKISKVDIERLNMANFSSKSITNSINNSSIKSTTKSIYRASYIKSNIDENHQFLLGPVGIDEGDTIDEKLNFAISAAEFMNKFGNSPKIAILAGGRKEDVGRTSIIDKSIEESENLVEKIEKSLLSSNFSSDFHVKNYYILIEKAIKEGNNIIVAPDGIIGNIIFRSLVLLSSWESYGAIALGLDKIFIDTSRDQSKDGYIRALRFAQTLVKKGL